MANKKQSNSKHDVEIEKFRNENKWDKLREYVKVLPKDSKYELLLKLCLAEADLERYLFFNPLFNDIERNTTFIIDYNLEKVEQYLNDVSKTDNKYTIEANILLSKLYYSQSRYNDTLSILNKTQLNILNNKSLRQTQLLAEACSLKGLCLENIKSQPNNNNNNNNKFENEIIKCYETASNLAVEYSESITKIFQQQQQQQQNLQQQQLQGSQQQSQKLNSYLLMQQTDDGFDLINPLYEIALQKVPILYIKQGNISDGLNRFRFLLSKPHIQSIITIRQSLLKKFGESLLTSVCASNYQPAKYEKRIDKLFKPNNLDEEILLCLTLSQYLASKEVMLLRQPDYKQTRDKTFNNAISSLDLLIIYLTYRRSFPILTEKFESTSKYSFEQFYVWYQYGLSLMCSKKFHKAYLILKECNRMKPDHITCILLLSQLAIEHLLLIDEAIYWAKQALSINTNNIKANILFGCSLIKKAHLEKTHSNKIKIFNEALDLFKKVVEINPYDYLGLYHLSLCYALLRKITESIDVIQKALMLKSDDKDCLHLLCLLLTSTKNYEEAYTVILKACSIYEDFELIYTKSRIEEHLFGFNEALGSLITLIEVYKKKARSLNNIHYTITNRSNGANTTLTINNETASSSIETASLANLQNTFKLNEAIGKTITMLLQTDTYVTKHISQQQQDQDDQQSQPQQENNSSIESYLQLIRILSEICEFYIRHNCITDAEGCLKEISNLHSMSYTYMYLKGRLYLHKKDYLNAKLYFNNSLSINPTHINSLEQISICLYYLKELNLAEKMIRDAITINSSLPHLWYILGYILDASNNNNNNDNKESASLKCYQTALQLESTQPIVQFSSLTKIL